jgi:trehalose 6-phosphate synthase
MTNFNDLKAFFAEQELDRVIIAADAETITHRSQNGDGIIEGMSAGGVSTALDPVAKASASIYIARAKTSEDLKVADKRGNFAVDSLQGNYSLKRLQVDGKDLDDYYYGFSNQTLWPLCHVSFVSPKFEDTWYEGFKRVNEKFAKAIKSELKGKTFVWVNDYQLCLVPQFLGKQKNTTVGLFWHIPWPTWEIFRILPQKEEILESMLNADFIAFHRNYQALNFMNCVRRELEARIDEEKRRIYYKGKVTTIANLPMGIDTDVVKSMVIPEDKSKMGKVVKNMLGIDQSDNKLNKLFDKYQVILGVDRLDYTKGLIIRLQSIERFFETNKKYLGKVIYLGIISPSRENIETYKAIEEQAKAMAEHINKRFGKGEYQPIHLVYHTLKREEVINLYQGAKVCLVTPRDDGMNLVSKEFVAASSVVDNPGMLVLSEFAGSATDLDEALIVNPYNFAQVSDAIKSALEMRREDKVKRIRNMTKNLDDNNVYGWAINFVKGSLSSKR